MGLFQPRRRPGEIHDQQGPVISGKQFKTAAWQQAAVFYFQPGEAWIPLFFNHGWTRIKTDGDGNELPHIVRSEGLRPAAIWPSGACPKKVETTADSFIAGDRRPGRHKQETTRSSGFHFCLSSPSVFIRVHPWLIIFPEKKRAGRFAGALCLKSLVLKSSLNNSWRLRSSSRRSRTP
jgi:hypothetical protein